MIGVKAFIMGGKTSGGKGGKGLGKLSAKKRHKRVIRENI